MIADAVSIRHESATCVDDVLRSLRQIAGEWPDAHIELPGRASIKVLEIVTPPDQPEYMVYRDRESLERQDPARRILIQTDPFGITFVVDGWASGSGRLVRRILGIDR